MGALARLTPTRPLIDAQDRAELFEAIRSRSFKTGKFILSSGKESNLYFNMKPTMMWPRGAELGALALLEISAELGADYAGGLEMGAVPLIGAMAAISSIQGKPIRTFFVRKEAKKHGTMDLIEGLAPGESVSGTHVLIVDDVATSGTSFMKAIDAAQSAGGIVKHAACIVNREEGAGELLTGHGITLHSVFKAHEFLEAGPNSP
jgi:orotate phosphoribosyltransferase